MANHTVKVAVFALALATLGLGSSTALAERGYYKWVDARGNPQHSDRPPPGGVEYEFVSTETGFKRRVRPEDQNEDMSAPSMPAVSRSSNKSAPEQVAVEKDPALCDRAKANLDTLNSQARVRIRDGEEIRYLTPEEIETQKIKAEKTIGLHCTS